MATRLMAASLFLGYRARSGFGPTVSKAVDCTSVVAKERYERRDTCSIRARVHGHRPSTTYEILEPNLTRVKRHPRSAQGCRFQGDFGAIIPVRYAASSSRSQSPKLGYTDLRAYVFEDARVSASSCGCDRILDRAVFQQLNFLLIIRLHTTPRLYDCTSRGRNLIAT